MTIIQEVSRHFVGDKQKRKISLLLNTYIEIPVSCLKTNKLTNQPTNQPENKSAERHTQIPLLSYQVDSKS